MSALPQEQRRRFAPISGPMCHEHGIRGYGNPAEGVMIVGIAPGRDEIERTKRPFTGASGTLLNELLQFAGWSRELVYTTNVICWNKNAPTEDEQNLCTPRLFREIASNNPHVIVTAGVIANEALTGAKRRKGSRGSVTWSPRFKCFILDTHHPSFALQSQSMDAVQDIIRDLSKIPAVLEWPRSPDHAKIIYNTIDSLFEAQVILDRLPKNTIVTLDIETSNTDLEEIDAYSDSLLCFAISYLHEGVEYNYVFPKAIFPECVRNGTHATSFRKEGACPACNLSRTVLDWPLDVQWGFQAGQYDIHGLSVYFGVQLPLRDDTMLMSHCIDERPGHHGLKTNAREWLGAGWWEAEVKPFYRGKMDKLRPETINLYNAKDAAYTRRLAPIFQKRMAEDETTTLYTDLLLPAMQCFIDQQVRGIGVDFNRLKELAYGNWFPKWLEMHRDLQVEAKDIGWETDDFNSESSPQMRRLFYDILGQEPTKFSAKTGKPSLDKETLDRLDHPFAAKIRAFRTLDTITGYVLAVTDHMKHDGLLHPSAFVTTTRTGRTSYRNPAMQTLPKDYTVGADYARLREIIVPHNQETHELIEADFNQIEVWLAWAESRDPTLLEHLQSGDVHSATAEGAFNVLRGQFSKAEWSEYRQNAKKIRFGLQYGEGAEKLASPRPVGIGGTVDAARRFVNNFWKTYPAHRRWTLDIQRQVAEQGFLRTPTGRVMRFPIVMDHRALRQAINFPVQANASDYCLLSMIKLAPLLKQYNSHIILMIHDALVVESDRRYRPQVTALIKQVMEEPKWSNYPGVKVDIKVGNNLGTLNPLSSGSDYS